MNDLINKIKGDLKEAMRAAQTTRISTIRMLLSAVHNKEIELGKKETGLTDEEVMDVIRSESKKRRDAIEGFEKGGRPESAQQEKDELAILESYLPPEISDEELLAIVKKGIEDSGATTAADFGKAMKIISPLLKGKAAGSRIASAVKKELGQ
ncbi:MAG: GatB/YqeY domain-containing protein [Candidatus Tagabacteria bacterium]